MLITAIDLQGCLMRFPGLIILASFLVDNSTLQGGQAAVGTYQFTDTALGIRKYVVNGCYRLAWYFQAPPFWAQFIIFCNILADEPATCSSWWLSSRLHSRPIRLPTTISSTTLMSSLRLAPLPLVTCILLRWVVQRSLSWSRVFCS